MKGVIVLASVLICSVASAQPQPPSPQAEFTSPFDYCKAYGTVDRPGPRYKGPKVVPEMAAALGAGSDRQDLISWRCVNGAVLSCIDANAPVCGKALWLRNPPPKPPASIIESCNEQPDEEIVAGSHGEWGCKEGVPVVRLNQYKVDGRGFALNVWKRVTPSASAPSSQPAPPQQTVASLPPQRASTELSARASQCVFQDAWNPEMIATVGRGVRVAQEVDDISNSLNSIVAKAKDPKRPLVQQISSDDAKNFERLRQNLMLPQVIALLERRRIRDLEVAKKMVALADQSYRFGIEPGEDSPDARALSSLRLIRDSLDEKSFQISAPSDNCDIDAAIFGLENEAVAKVAGLDLRQANSIAEELRAKYKMQDRIDPEKLDVSDRQKWEVVLRDVVLPSERVRSYVMDLESARIALRASDLIYKNDLQDAQSSKGNIESVGLSIKARVESNQLEQSLVTAMGIWRVLNETDLVGASSASERAR